MTAWTKRRSTTLALLLSLLVATALPTVSKVPAAPVPVTEVVGSVPYPILACAGCVAGGVFLTLGGWASVMAAAIRPGSALAAAACGYACYRAVTW